MPDYPVLLALKNYEDIGDADFELGETRDELFKKIANAKRKEAMRKGELDESTDGASSEGELTPDTGAEISQDVEESGVTTGVGIARLMEEYSRKISSYYALSSLVVVMPPILSGAQLKSKFYDAVGEYSTIEERDGYVVYGIRSDQLGDLTSKLASLNELVRGLSVLPESVLLSLVATFDSFIASIALGLLKSQPKRYEDDKKMISVKSVLSMNSFDDVISTLAEAEVDECMRGSHTSQVSFLEALADIKIREHYERFPEFVEIFERRNLVAHQRLVVNSTYIANCSAAGYDVSAIKGGDTLQLDSAYLRSSVNVLLEFGLLLLFVVWRKRFKNEGEQAFSELNRICFELIQRRSISVAARILDFALFKQNRRAQDQTIKMMIVNLANCYKKLENKEKMVQVLAEADWSSASDQFQISIAAVKDDLDGVLALMPRVIDDHVVGPNGFRTWPVFDSVRSEPRFLEKFSEVFGEPIGSAYVKEVDDKPEAASSANTTDLAVGESAVPPKRSAKTVH